MASLLCETNVYQQSFISFFVIATIIGFVLIFVDKRRWKEHTARSADMMKARWGKGISETIAENEISTEWLDKKNKKKKSKEPYEYQGRIKDRVLFTCAILCCGFGELLGMLFCRHKWYKPQFKIGMPIIAALNVTFIVLMYFACAEIGSEGGIFIST